MRLSRIAGNNLEKDGEGADYTAAQAAADDIMIDSADAELDFEETKEEGGWHGSIGDHVLGGHHGWWARCMCVCQGGMGAPDVI